MAPDFEFEDRDKVRSVNQRFVFGPFLSIEAAFVCPLTKHFDPCLHGCVDTKGNEPSSRFRVETKAQRFQNTVKPGCRSHALTLTKQLDIAGNEAFGCCGVQCPVSARSGARPEMVSGSEARSLNGSSPILTLIGGPNGPDKSTLIDWVDLVDSGLLLGPDAIARTINPATPKRVATAAGREMLKRVDECFYHRVS